MTIIEIKKQKKNSRKEKKFAGDAKLNVLEK